MADLGFENALASREEKSDKLSIIRKHFGNEVLVADVGLQLPNSNTQITYENDVGFDMAFK